MIGDKLIITDYHRSAAAAIFKKLKDKLTGSAKVTAVTVAGESGCGKSETATVLADLCAEAGYKALLLQQDDYFVYPPKTNHQKRLEDIKWVGLQEVKLDLIEANIAAIKEGSVAAITKPLVDYKLDQITDVSVSVERVAVVIIEGTYTTILKNADFKAFIDRNYRQTKKARLERSRDPVSDFIEKVLSIEHTIISAHKQLADLVIAPPDDELK